MYRGIWCSNHKTVSQPASQSVSQLACFVRANFNLLSLFLFANEIQNTKMNIRQCIVYSFYIFSTCADCFHCTLYRLLLVAGELKCMLFVLIHYSFVERQIHHKQIGTFGAWNNIHFFLVISLHEMNLNKLRHIHRNQTKNIHRKSKKEWERERSAALYDWVEEKLCYKIMWIFIIRYTRFNSTLFKAIFFFFFTQSHLTLQLGNFNSWSLTLLMSVKLVTFVYLTHKKKHHNFWFSIHQQQKRAKKNRAHTVYFVTEL